MRDIEISVSGVCDAWYGLWRILEYRPGMSQKSTLRPVVYSYLPEGLK